MRTSRIVTLASATALIALLFVAAVFFPGGTSTVAQSPAASTPTETATLEPVVVVATR